MTLGGVTLPDSTIITPFIRDIESVSYTYGGTRKSDWRAQKTDYSLTVPSIRAAYFNSLKALKEAHSSIPFVYPAESGTGNITKTVIIVGIPYDYLIHTSEYLVENLILSLEEV